MSERAFIELLYGEGAHANTLACIEDVAPDFAGRLTNNSPYSIWQLVFHMNFWMEYELKRIRGDNPRYPTHASESWPSDPTPRTGEEWRETITHFDRLLADFAKLADSPADVLAKHVEATHPNHAKRSSSLQAVLWQIVVHNSYHIGQVVMLRRSLGVWPPKGGGDSW
jgi:uncharacterized damage-inducible protein DinB